MCKAPRTAAEWFSGNQTTKEVLRDGLAKETRLISEAFLCAGLGSDKYSIRIGESLTDGPSWRN